ncbi:hypothetical protein AAFC00_006412 [Neodothiora populina]|uniref:GST N-terminal domain-containing protein n=1 Tax=Neodothiora populina TaxID=2781224 RepID=A0ABR3P6F3_9PEZI
MDSKTDDVVFFYYPESGFQHRVHWYLKLAEVSYSECLQPACMPRPDLAALGVSYRRIPILSIGKHIYCDSNIILRVLQDEFPLEHESLDQAERGMQALFRAWSLESGLFRHAADFIPFEHFSLDSDPNFVADRKDYMSPAPFDPSEMIKARPESMTYLRSACEMLETMFLADGRNWILGSKKGPSVVDIEAVFPLYLAFLVWGAPSEVIQATCPKTYAWILRFHQAVTDASGSSAPKPKSLTGEEVKKRILDESAPESDETYISAMGIDETDSTGLTYGQMVEVWPTDTGSNSRQRGKLVGLSPDEVCVRNEMGIFVHFPRWNYGVEPVE